MEMDSEMDTGYAVTAGLTRTAYGFTVPVCHLASRDVVDDAIAIFSLAGIAIQI